MKKYFVAVLLIGIFSSMLCGCNSSVTTPPNASYYLINASPDSQGLDFFLDGATVISDLIYAEDTGYFSAAPGIHNLVFRKTGATDDLINVNISLTAAQSYSIFLIDSVSKLRPAAVADNAPIPPADSIEIRLLNFCINSPVLLAQFAGVTDTLNYSSRTFNDQNTDTTRASFKRIIAGNYTLNLKLSSDSSLVSSFSNLAFGGGKIYTVYLRGFYDTSAQKLSSGIIKHN